MHGFGPVVREEHEPVFHEAWEGRTIAMRILLGPMLSQPYPGVARQYIESIPPAEYLEMSYYERFLDSAIRRAIDDGLFTAEELAYHMRRIEAEPAAPSPSRVDPAVAHAANERVMRQLRPEAEGRAPRFEPGDPVRAINISRVGHNRLPRYVRGKQGWIERVNGLYPIEDAKAFAEDPVPQTVYTVGFEGVEIWGPESERGLRVYLELWEGYLEPSV
jgi:nitrile hydratase